MSKSMLLAWTEPSSSDQEAEFNRWYDDVHVPEVRGAVPSISAVHRFRAADLDGVTGDDVPNHRYLAVYEMESSDVTAAVAALEESAATGKVVLSPLLDLTKRAPVMRWYVHV